MSRRAGLGGALFDFNDSARSLAFARRTSQGVGGGACRFLYQTQDPWCASLLCFTDQVCSLRSVFASRTANRSALVSCDKPSCCRCCQPASLNRLGRVPTGRVMGRYAALEDGAAAALAEATLLGPAAVQRMDAQVPGSGGPGRGEAASPRPGAAGALPSHISIFGEGSGGGAELGGAEVGGGGGGVRLPSHISAFGDDSEGAEAGELGGRVAGLVSHALDGVEPSPREGTPPGACRKQLGVCCEAWTPPVDW